MAALEGLLTLLVATGLYAQGGHSWVTFAVLCFVRDLCFACNLAGPRGGAIIQNLAHSYAGPLTLSRHLRRKSR